MQSSDGWFLRVPTRIRDTLENIARPQGNTAAAIARQVLTRWCTEQAINQGRADQHKAGSN